MPSPFAPGLAALLIAGRLAAAPQPPAHPPAPRSAPAPAGAAAAAAPTPGGDAFASLAPAGVIAALGPFVPAVGAWVEYGVRPRRPARAGPAASAGGLDARVRLSVLPPALAGGRYWLELASATPAGLAVATRLLVHGDPSAPGSIDRMIVFVAGQAAFELPVDEARAAAAGASPTGATPTGVAADTARAPSVRALQPGRVQTPAGSFLADRLRVAIAGEGTTLLYRASAVPLWGLVRAEGPRSTVELLGFSLQGAHSLVPAQAGNDLAETSAVPTQGKGKESTK